MAEIADFMHGVGVPVSREVNQELYDRFARNMRIHRTVIEEKANSPEVRERLWERLAFEQAKRIRHPTSQPKKWDPDDYEMRKNKRLEEIRTAHARERWIWSIGSADHIVAYLKARGVPMYFLTEKGRTSTKKDVLEHFAHLPEVRAILDYRENAKMFSTFVFRMFDRYEKGEVRSWGYADADDRIHPRWSVQKITGRWGAEEPSVQNTPKADPKKGRPNLRTQFVAPKGRKFVGFDFCLAEGTLVDTPEGKTPIEELKEGDLVFAYDVESHRPTCSRVARVKATGIQPTLKVVLDNGEEVRCTAEHRWLVRPWGAGRNFVEVEARDLRVGNRLLPLRRGLTGPQNSKYETLYSYSAFEYVKTHVAVTRDNRPSNLTYKDATLHVSEHATVSTARQWQDPEVRKRMQKGISDSIRDRGGYWGKNNPRWGDRSGVSGACPNCGQPTYFGGKYPRRFCSRRCYHEFRKNNPGLPRGTKWHDLNHKIVAIIDDGLAVPTYDIEVAEHHNFALAAGVFVHNCQLEARIIALMSGDPFLCNVFRHPPIPYSEGDIHTVLARVVWPNFDEVPKDQRKVLRDTIKRPEYGAFYGGQIETLWKNIVKDYPSVKLQDIARMVALMAEKMPGVAAWHQELIRNAARPPHEIRSAIYGRRRCFPLGNADINDLWNFPVQCGQFDQKVLTDTGWVEYQHLDPERHALVQHAGCTRRYEVVPTGTHPVLDVQTQGRRVKVTSNHRLLTYTGDDKVEWRPAGELTRDDWIVVREAAPEADNASEVDGITEDVAECIGALFGNGYYRTGGFTLSTGSPKYQEYFARLARRVLPEFRIVEHRAVDGTFEVSSYSSRIQERLLQWGFPPASKKDKRLPVWAETAPRRIQVALLRGLFDTDGGFAGRWMNYTTCIQSQAETVHRLLLICGVDARVRKVWSTTPHGERRRYYRVQLMPWGVPEFKEQVGFRHPERAVILRDREMAAVRRQLPVGLVRWVGLRIHDRVRDIRKSWVTRDHARLTSIRKGRASVAQIVRVLDCAEALGVDVSDLRRVATQWRFEKVVSIAKRRAAVPTYDVTIFEEAHDYVVEGIVTHNSTGADIMDTGLLRIWSRLGKYKDCWPILQIHDAAVFECYEDDAPKLVEDVKECFAQEHTIGNITVPFPVEPEIGDTWAEV